MARIDAFLKLGASQGCSDVHLAVGVPPMLRMNGELLPIKFRNLAEAELEPGPSGLRGLPDGAWLDGTAVGQGDLRHRGTAAAADPGLVALAPTGHDIIIGDNPPDAVRIRVGPSCEVLNVEDMETSSNWDIQGAPALCLITHA